MKAIVKHGGERIDRIAKDLLGTEQNGAVAALLDANPGLATLARNGIVPEGVEIVAPEDFEPAPQDDYVLAWGQA